MTKHTHKQTASDRTETVFVAADTAAYDLASLRETLHGKIFPDRDHLAGTLAGLFSESGWNAPDRFDGSFRILSAEELCDEISGPLPFTDIACPATIRTRQRFRKTNSFVFV